MGQIIKLTGGHGEQEPLQPTITPSSLGEGACVIAQMPGGTTGFTGTATIRPHGHDFTDWNVSMPTVRRVNSNAPCLLDILRRGATNGLQITQKQQCLNCGGEFTPAE